MLDDFAALAACQPFCRFSILTLLYATARLRGNFRLAFRYIIGERMREFLLRVTNTLTRKWVISTTMDQAIPVSYTAVKNIYAMMPAAGA